MKLIYIFVILYCVTFCTTDECLIYNQVIEEEGLLEDISIIFAESHNKDIADDSLDNKHQGRIITFADGVININESALTNLEQLGSIRISNGNITYKKLISEDNELVKIPSYEEEKETKVSEGNKNEESAENAQNGEELRVTVEGNEDGGKKSKKKTDKAKEGKQNKTKSNWKFNLSRKSKKKDKIKADGIHKPENVEPEPEPEPELIQKVKLPLQEIEEKVTLYLNYDFKCTKRAQNIICILLYNTVNDKTFQRQHIYLVFVLESEACVLFLEEMLLKQERCDFMNNLFFIQLDNDSRLSLSPSSEYKKWKYLKDFKILKIEDRNERYSLRKEFRQLEKVKMIDAEKKSKELMEEEKSVKIKIEEIQAELKAEEEIAKLLKAGESKTAQAITKVKIAQLKQGDEKAAQVDKKITQSKAEKKQQTDKKAAQTKVEKKQQTDKKAAQTKVEKKQQTDKNTTQNDDLGQLKKQMAREKKTTKKSTTKKKAGKEDSQLNEKKNEELEAEKKKAELEAEVNAAELNTDTGTEELKPNMNAAELNTDADTEDPKVKLNSEELGAENKILATPEKIAQLKFDMENAQLELNKITAQQKLLPFKVAVVSMGSGSNESIINLNIMSSFKEHYGYNGLHCGYILLKMFGVDKVKNK
jgi:hypothetical protein